MRSIVNKLIERNITLTLAESMTGGFISSEITKIPNASKIFKGSIIAYSKELKIRLLNVEESTIDKYSTVSIEVLNEMTEGLKKLIKADLYISITGNAGPSYEQGSNELKCYILIEYNEEKHYEIVKFERNNRIKNIKRVGEVLVNTLNVII